MAGKWNSPPRAIVAALSLWLVPMAGALASQRSEAPASVASDAIDEVVVTGKTIGQMRRDIERAEDRFFNAYNAINKNTEFDVNCGLEALTGTRLLGHQCKAAFFEEAQAQEARVWLQGDGYLSAQSVYLARLPEFRQNVIKVLSEHPEVAQLLFDRIELQRRYEKELRARQTRSPRQP